MARTRRCPSRFPLLLGLAVALLLGPATAGAWDAAALATLKATKSCPGCDLSGATLFGTTLSGTTLSGANLGGADLRGAILSVADLRMADLTWATLAGATLREAKLGGATWTDGKTKCKPPSVGTCNR
jgi:hypothetical protein